jgi:hypothetical protein
LAEKDSQKSRSQRIALVCSLPQKMNNLVTAKIEKQFNRLKKCSNISVRVLNPDWDYKKRL